MSYDAHTLYTLLPAIYRIRDAEIAATMPDPLTPAEQLELASLTALPSLHPHQQARLSTLQEKKTRGPLKALLTAFSEEIAVLEEDLAQLYDDLFIETCSDWAVPYIGDLIGYQPLHKLGQTRSLARAEVAHTIALRRRKGTAPVLEQLAKDVTGWQARVVEFFQLLGTTQYMNHLRPYCHYSPDMRKGETLSQIGTAFDTTAHTVDVRRIETGRGKFNIANIGLFLWRIDAYSQSKSPAVPVDGRRYLISPLGNPLSLYTRPQTEDEITHLAEQVNVPSPISRRAMASRLPIYYGLRQSPGDDIDTPEPSVLLYVDEVEIAREQVVVCNLSDHGMKWANEPPPGMYGIDPELGRIAVANDLPVPRSVRITYHYGFPGRLGGGEYDRKQADDAPDVRIIKVPSEYASLTEALTHLDGDGVVEIEDSGRYEETPVVGVKSGGHLILRSKERCRPTIVLSGDLQVSGGEGSGFTLDGVLLGGGCLRVLEGGDLSILRIRHATLVPGLSLDATGGPVAPGSASLSIDQPAVRVELDHAVIGSLRVNVRSSVTAAACVIDATDAIEMAFCGPDGMSHGGMVSLAACTVIGRILAHEIGTITNSILLGQPQEGSTMPAVHIVRRQVGCVRFSWLPENSHVPRRFQCQPEDRETTRNTAPHFTTLRYGEPAYCQLARSTPESLRRGGDDEGEMGVYHDVFPAQREANLQIRVQEFLRVGLAAGIFYES